MGDCPLRIAVVIGKISYGGIENVVANYYRAIDKKKVQFDFFYGADSLEEPKEEFIAMGARYYKLPPEKHPLSFRRELRKHLRENHYTIIHAHMNTLSFLAIGAAKAEGVPVRICHNHSVPSGEAFLKKLLKGTLRLLCRRGPTDYFACAEKSARWFFGDKAFEEGRVKIINNAIDFNRFSFSEDRREQTRKKYDLDGKYVVGHVGRFTYAKNHMLIIDAFKEVRKLRSDAVLVLVGDGELKDMIISKIKAENLEDSVLMVGQTDNPELFYPAFDVMLLPSVFEGLPMMVVEGQAALRPIVVSEVTPDEAIFSNGVFRCSKNDSPSVWAERMLEASKTEVVIDNRSDRFRVERQAEDLCEWYLNKDAEISRGKK